MTLLVCQVSESATGSARGPGITALGHAGDTFRLFPLVLTLVERDLDALLEGQHFLVVLQVSI